MYYVFCEIQFFKKFVLYKLVEKYALAEFMSLWCTYTCKIFIAIAYFIG